MLRDKNKNVFPRAKREIASSIYKNDSSWFSEGVYLDYASTTPVDLRVLKEMQPYFSRAFGNPGSLHRFGQIASGAVFKSRRKIADTIGANYKEIVFTGSATEANNLALRGITQTVRRLTQKNFRDVPRPISVSPRPRLIVSAIEHESILETARDLKREGVEVIYLPVDEKGLVDLKKLKASLNERTILVSVMYANNEIGTIEPIFEIAKIVRDFRNSKNNLSRRSGTPPSLLENLNSAAGQPSASSFPVFHTDAVQAFQYLDCNVNKLGIDLMTLSAHKIYGPKGIGLLYSRISNFQFPISNQIQNSKFQILKPIITGGGQENGLRSGTENVPAIVGFARAAEIADKLRDKEKERIKKLRDYFWEKIKRIYPKAELNGPELKKRIANNLNIYFPGFLANDLLIQLDLNGISASSGSACSSRRSEPSYVLRAIGLKKETSLGSIRFTLGRHTKKAQIDKVAGIFKNIIKR